MFLSQITLNYCSVHSCEAEIVTYQALLSNYRTAAFFMRGVSIASWYYVGSAGLVSSQGRDGVHDRYTYRLDEKLPHDLWVKLGGYENWLIAVGGEKRQCSTAEQCMQIVRSHWGTTADEVEVMRYEGDSVWAFTNAEQQCALFYCKDDECDKTSKNSKHGEESVGKVIFHASDGHEIEAEPDWIISKQAALGVIEKFVSTGDVGQMME